MPFDHEVDQVAALVTIRVRTCADPHEAITKARELIKDKSIDASCRWLIVVDEMSRDATTQELRELAEILKLLGRKFSGR